MTPPLPDSDRSRRVYPLLQNQDLENVSQATLKSVGDPISIENLNEDELRKLVLVNLARLSVKGEWNGLLTASGGGGSPILTLATSLNTSQKTHFISAYPPFPRTVLASGSQAVTTKCIFFPFMLPKDLTFASMTINITSGAAGDDLDMAIYNTDSTSGVPTTKVSGTDVTFATGSTTGIVANFAASVSLTGGTMYWLGMVKNSGTVTLRSHSSYDGYPQAPISDMSNFNVALINEDTGSGGLPTTFTASDYENSYGFVPFVGLVTT